MKSIHIFNDKIEILDPENISAIFILNILLFHTKFNVSLIFSGSKIYT